MLLVSSVAIGKLKQKKLSSFFFALYFLFGFAERQEREREETVVAVKKEGEEKGWI